MKFEQLQKDMIAAMKARDKVRKDAISALVSAAKKVAIDEGCRDNISEEIVDRVILKEIKLHNISPSDNSLGFGKRFQPRNGLQRQRMHGFPAAAQIVR